MKNLEPASVDTVPKPDTQMRRELLIHFIVDGILQHARANQVEEALQIREAANMLANRNDRHREEDPSLSSGEGPQSSIVIVNVLRCKAFCFACSP